MSDVNSVIKLPPSVWGTELAVTLYWTVFQYVSSWITVVHSTVIYVTVNSFIMYQTPHNLTSIHVAKSIVYTHPVSLILLTDLGQFPLFTTVIIQACVHNQLTAPCMMTLSSFCRQYCRERTEAWLGRHCLPDGLTHVRTVTRGSMASEDIFIRPNCEIMHPF